MSHTRFRIQSQDQIEIYATPEGYCRIVQEEPNGESQVIDIAPNNVEEVCRILQEVKRAADSELFGKLLRKAIE